MTVKYLTGAYPAGYALSATYTGLDIEATATVGGTGVSANFNTTIQNYGAVSAAAGSDGVLLSAGGIVTNGSSSNHSALVEGDTNGLVIFNASGTVTNFGTITTAAGRGVNLGQGGVVTNGGTLDTTALISGDIAIEVDSQPGTIENFGTVSGGFAGIFLWDGRVTNGSATDTTARIYGSLGVEMGHTAATLANFGTIVGGSYQGVYLQSAGRITNGSATDTEALIVAGVGVRIGTKPATVRNFGTILGQGASYSYDAGLFDDSGTLSLINGSALDSQALIAGYNGVVLGGAGVVTNFGVIWGNEVGPGHGSAVFFTQRYSNTDHLIAEAGSSFLGVVTLNQGSLQVVSGTVNFTGGIVTSGTVSGAGTLWLTGGSTQLNAGASLTVARITVPVGEVDVATNLTYSGVWTQSGGDLTIDMGDRLTLNAATFGDGKANVTGSGTLSFASGSQAIDIGASVSVANWSLTGGTAAINEDLTYTGAFSEGAGAILTLTAGHKLTLTGADSLSGTIHGASRVTVSSATVSGLTIGGTVIFEDAGSVDQTGAVAVGDKTTQPATLTIDAGATWTMAGGGGIARGSSPRSVINVKGTLTTQEGVSLIAVKVVDTGSMAATVGILDFTRAISGTGAMSVDTGATLEADLTVGSGLSMTFNGDNALLDLKDPRAFAATINGFAPTDAIDLLKIAATSAVLGAGDTLVITNGSFAVATLHLAGSYTGDTFTATSDGSGGTDITVSTGAAVAASSVGAMPSSHGFIAAMAGLGVSGAGFETGAGYRPHSPPILISPRSQMA